MDFQPAELRSVPASDHVSPTLRAFAPLPELGPLARYTVQIVVNVGTFTRELAKIRPTADGTDIGGRLDESVCVAAPLWGPLGRMYATIAVRGRAPRMSSKKEYVFLPAMREAASAIAATPFSTDSNLATPSERPRASRTRRIAA
jgi:DNA-binding IclR family transcriptional regulator